MEKDLNHGKTLAELADEYRQASGPRSEDADGWRAGVGILEDLFKMPKIYLMYCLKGKDLSED